MPKLERNVTHQPGQNHHTALRQFEDLGVSHETAVRSAFRSLSASNGARVRCRSGLCARQHDWTLVPEWEIRRPRQQPVRVDGALRDNFRPTRNGIFRHLRELAGKPVAITEEAVRTASGMQSAGEVNVLAETVPPGIELLTFKPSEVKFLRLIFRWCSKPGPATRNCAPLAP